MSLIAAESWKQVGRSARCYQIANAAQNGRQQCGRRSLSLLLQLQHQ